MVGVFEGVCVLGLLSVFFAYLLAPAVAAVRRRVRGGRRNRPVSTVAAIVLIYAALFVPVGVVWHLYKDRVTRWVEVTAPDAVDRLFSGEGVETVDRLIAGLPRPLAGESRIRRSIGYAIAAVERETRSTLHDLIAAAPYAGWLTVTPILAFVLLTTAPGFQRSTLRVLPRGHLQWRAEEYLRDVNSALAGYVRAQAAAAVIVGGACAAGFTLIGVESAISIGVAAGVLELVPALGPVMAALMSAANAMDRLVAVVAFLALVRVVQDYVIYPRLIRRGMHLSTPAVLVTLWGGAVVAGAAGVLLAIPLAGCVSVSIRHWREYRDIERLVRAAGRK
jgi:predicted PurR-regulated permease PerM